MTPKDVCEVDRDKLMCNFDYLSASKNGTRQPLWATIVN
jgi:hypothetical protein